MRQVRRRDQPLLAGGEHGTVVEKAQILTTDTSRRPSRGRRSSVRSARSSPSVADAPDNRTEFGVWGGMTERESQALLLQQVSMRYAASLDDALSAQGWVSTSVARLRQPTWAPWVDQVSARVFAHRWPAAYNGTVWTHVVPVPQNVSTPHVIRLAWGGWHRDLTVELDRVGLLLLTGKAKDEDGVSVTFHLDCDDPVYVVFGAGEVPGQPQLDIRDGWSRW